MKYGEEPASERDRNGAWFKWANALDEQAEKKKGQEADGLFAQAYEKDEAALTFQPDKHVAFNNWGVRQQRAWRASAHGSA